LGLCATGLAGLGIWKPQGVQDALAALIFSGAVVTLLLIAAGYILAGVALEKLLNLRLEAVSTAPERSAFDSKQFDRSA